MHSFPRIGLQTNLLPFCANGDHPVLFFSNTVLPKHVADARLMFVLIENVHLVGTINGAPLHKNARIG